MTPQELKNSILQLAIQGKLIEQRPEEGTAEELFREIQKEKQTLIKAGKIKKEKPLPEITEDELPFDIPETWKWVRLGNAISLLSGSDLTPDKYNAQCKGIPYITGASNIEGHTIIINRWTEHPNNIARYGDLLLTCKGTVGKTTILTEKEVHIARQIMAITPVLVDTVFIQRFIECQVENLKSKAKSMIPGIERDSVLKLTFPLSPLAEQKRIVAKIEELLPLIDRYEKAWTRLEDFNKRFPGDMQKSILQMAIQGKLVEQRPEEGTGEELYQQIQKEKQALIKAGKVKKEKPLPEISEDEIPFDIPETWKWARLPDVSSMCLGKMLDKQKNKGISCPYLRNVNVRWGSFELSDLLEMKFEDEMDERFLIQPGDLVMCEGGEPGRCAVWKEPYSIHFQKALHRIRFYNGLLSQFYQLLFYAYSNAGIMAPLFTGTTIKHLTGQALEKVLIPLPPLAEQKRIVARLEELLPLCEKLK